MSNTKELLVKYGQAVQYLPPRLRSYAMSIADDEKLNVEEFRLRAGRELSISINGKEKSIPNISAVRHEELQTVLELATKSSVHTAQSSIKEGFVTVSGGHRVGICGTAIRCGDEIEGIRELSSVSIRIAKAIESAADGIVENVQVNGSFTDTLIISPPGCGKTTTLRDLVRRLSNIGYRISLVDERGEVAAKKRGVPQFDVGRCTDVIDGAEKARGAMLMLRSMSPDIIALDEITAQHDVDAISLVANCGVRILATAHAGNKEEAMTRPLYRRLFELGIFRTLITLKRRGDVFTYSMERI